MHMLRRWLGDEAFAKGLKAYSKNTSTTTLLDVTSGMHSLMLLVKMSLVSWILGWSNQVTVVSAEVVDDTLILSQNNSSLVNMKIKGVFGKFH